MRCGRPFACSEPIGDEENMLTDGSGGRYERGGRNEPMACALIIRQLCKWINCIATLNDSQAGC